MCACRRSTVLEFRPALRYIVQCVVVTLARLGIELAPGVKDLLAAHGMMPDVDLRTGPAVLHELVQFAPAPLLRRFISTSSQGLVLKSGLNKGKRISSGRDLQRIGKVTELRRKKKLPSSDDDAAEEPGEGMP
jgi:hypothetical protein